MMATYTAFIYDGRSDEMLRMIETELPHLSRTFLREIELTMMDLCSINREFLFAHIHRDGIPVQAVSMDIHTSYWPETIRTAMFFTSSYSNGRGYNNWHRLRDIVLSC